MIKNLYGSTNVTVNCGEILQRSGDYVAGWTIALVTETQRQIENKNELFLIMFYQDEWFLDSSWDSYKFVKVDYV